MNTLKLEGAKTNIGVNAISPVAATRMTDTLMPPPMLARFAPEHVTPSVVYLASQDAPNGAILTAGAGTFALAQVVETQGTFLGAGATAEAVRDKWCAIANPAGAEAVPTGAAQTQKFLAYPRTRGKTTPFCRFPATVAPNAARGPILGCL